MKEECNDFTFLILMFFVFGIGEESLTEKIKAFKETQNNKVS